jgi:peptidoglycan/LPS O-acetylase OafA/YrhL
VAGSITLLIAELMRRFVEKPCAVLRRRLHHTLVAPRSPAAASGERT